MSCDITLLRRHIDVGRQCGRRYEVRFAGHRLPLAVPRRELAMDSASCHIRRLMSLNVSGYVAAIASRIPIVVRDPSVPRHQSIGVECCLRDAGNEKPRGLFWLISVRPTLTGLPLRAKFLARLLTEPQPPAGALLRMKLQRHAIVPLLRQPTQATHASNAGAVATFARCGITRAFAPQQRNEIMRQRLSVVHAACRRCVASNGPLTKRG